MQIKRREKERFEGQKVIRGVSLGLTHPVVLITTSKCVRR